MADSVYIWKAYKHLPQKRRRGATDLDVWSPDIAKAEQSKAQAEPVLTSS